MIKKLGLTLLCTAALFTAPSHAVVVEAAKPTEIKYELKPEVAEVITNFLLWEAKGTCTISTGTPNVPLAITVLKGKGSIDKEPMKQGDYKLLHVSNGQTFYLTADRGAKVELINHGDVVISATCLSG